MKKINYYLIIFSLTLTFCVAMLFHAFAQIDTCYNGNITLSPPMVDVNSGNRIVRYACTGSCVEPFIQIWLVHIKRNQPYEYRDAGTLAVNSNCEAVHINALPYRDLQRAAKMNLGNIYSGEDWEYGGGEWFYQYQVGETLSAITGY